MKPNSAKIFRIACWTKYAQLSGPNGLIGRGAIKSVVLEVVKKKLGTVRNSIPTMTARLVRGMA